jgi:ABC-type Fe3+ transport system substrate-binding protein
MVAVSFIGGGNRITQRKPEIFWKWLKVIKTVLTNIQAQVSDKVIKAVLANRQAQVSDKVIKAVLANRQAQVSGQFFFIRIWIKFFEGESSFDDLITYLCLSVS